ncbi:MAG: alpha-L-fucosidase [Clostridia bacterium]|nr:alpha-L-fucosidase [Clostridia bacterium]
MIEKFEKYGIKPYGAIPNARQMEWYEREKMIFFHFGMNTFTDREWGDGTESPELFNPTELDVRQWVRTVRDAGFKCAIITAKHHDGFCLWQTKYTEHSVKNSPYKNGKGDIVREFTDACAEFGIKAGIYLSPWDRHEPSWGREEYNDFYVGQLTELLTGYGKIWECWWDGAGSTEAVYDWERWATTVRTLQPDAVIFGSLGATPWVDVRWVGNEKGIAGKPCYATIDPISLEVETTSELNSGKPGGERFIPAEVDVSIRPGWFYHSSQDESVRTPENLMDLWFTSNGSNAGLLLNLPPDRRGKIHENDVNSLLAFEKRLRSAFENNLAGDAKINASSEREGCSAANLLYRSRESFYAPLDSDKTPEIIFDLPEERKINAFVLEEAIELGHRVTDAELSALVDGEWRTVAKCQCIGYRLSEKFDTVRTKSVKIKIKSAYDTPVLYFFGAYYISTMKKENEGSKNMNLAENARVEIDDGAICVNLGGIYPFSKIILGGVCDGEYTLSLFNGFSFNLIGTVVAETGEAVWNFDNKIDYSYRFRIETKANVDREKVNIKIF